MGRGFGALRHRNFRLYWSGQVVSLVGTWMQSVSLPWLVLELGGSPFQVGTNMPAANLVLGKPNFTIPSVGAPDPNKANMGGPYGLALTVGGHLLVSDVAFHRAQRHETRLPQGIAAGYPGPPEEVDLDVGTVQSGKVRQAQDAPAVGQPQYFGAPFRVVGSRRERAGGRAAPAPE